MAPDLPGLPVVEAVFIGLTSELNDPSVASPRYEVSSVCFHPSMVILRAGLPPGLGQGHARGTPFRTWPDSPRPPPGSVWRGRVRPEGGRHRRVGRHLRRGRTSYEPPIRPGLWQRPVRGLLPCWRRCAPADGAGRAAGSMFARRQQERRSRPCRAQRRAAAPSGHELHPAREHAPSRSMAPPFDRWFTPPGRTMETGPGEGVVLCDTTRRGAGCKQQFSRAISLWGAIPSKIVGIGRTEKYNQNFKMVGEKVCGCARFAEAEGASCCARCCAPHVCNQAISAGYKKRSPALAARLENFNCWKYAGNDLTQAFPGAALFVCSSRTSEVWLSPRSPDPGRRNAPNSVAPAPLARLVGQAGTSACERLIWRTGPRRCSRCREWAGVVNRLAAMVWRMRSAISHGLPW